MFDEHGVRLEDKESLLTQPIDPRFPEAKNVTVLKEMVIFITPPQQNTELLLTRGWRLRLVGVRASDGYQSQTSFPFTFLPHDFYDPCIFCCLRPDGYPLPASLPAPISPARPGIRKRKMEGVESAPPPAPPSPPDR